MKYGIGLATAFRTLTIFTVPGKESKSLVTSLYWFVIVGATLGLMSYGIIYLLLSRVSSFLISSIVITFLVWATRAFHLDGLGDMADGFGGGWTKERVLEIMKDSHIGAFGSISISLLLIIKVASLTNVIENGNFSLIILIMSFSRFFLVFLAHVSPYARKEGGTAHSIVGEAKIHHVGISFLQVLLLSFFFKEYVLQVILLFIVGFITSLFILYKGKKRIDGITGDMLGATCEISEALMLIIASL